MISARGSLFSRNNSQSCPESEIRRVEPGEKVKTEGASLNLSWLSPDKHLAFTTAVDSAVMALIKAGADQLFLPNPQDGLIC